MNPDNPQSPGDELEARLTALLLGELSDEEAASLRRNIEHDPNLATLYERLKRTIDLAREATTNPTEQTAAQPAPLRLSEERRQKLLAHFKTVTPTEFVQPRQREFSWIVPVGAAAAILVLAAISVPNFTKARESAAANSVMNNLRILEGAKEQWALENKKSSTDTVSLADLKPYLKGNEIPQAVLGENYIVGTVSDPVIADLDAKQAKKQFGRMEADLLSRGERGERARLSADAGLTYADKSGTPSSAPQSGGVYSVNAVGYKPVPVPQAQAEALQNRLAREPAIPAYEGQQSVADMEARNVVATRRQEIVLPSSVEPAEAAAEQLETRVLRVDPNAAEQTLGDFALARRAEAGGFGGGGGGLAGNVDAFSVPRDPAKEVARERGDAMVRREPSKQVWAQVPQVSTLSGVQGSTAPSFAGATPAATPVPTMPALEDAVAPKEPEWIGTLAATGSKADNVPVLGDTPALGTPLRTDTKAAGAPGYYNRLMMERYGLIPKGPPPSAGGAPTEYGLAPSATLGSAGKDLSTWAADQSGVVVTDGLASVSERPPVQEMPKNTQLAYDFNRGFAQSAARGREAAEINVGLADLSAQPAKPATVAAGESVGRKSSGIALPPGTNISPTTDVNRALSLYAELEDRTLLRSQNLPPADVLLQEKPPMSKEEAVKSLGLALASNDIVMVPVGDKFIKAVPSIEALAEGRVLNEKGGLDEVKAKRELENLQKARDSRAEFHKQATVAGTEALEERLVGQDKEIARAKENLERLERESKSQEVDDDRPVAPRKPAPNAPIPQPEIQTHDNAWSTFSLNVSDVSFKLTAASLEKGSMPEPASVRSEEFINAFDYRDPEPPPGVPIAFAWERARYPFAHNRDLLRFSVKTAAAGRQLGRPLNVVLLVDNSGSMERADRARIIHEALRVLAAQLQPQDKLSVITFARTPRLWVDGVPGNQAGGVAEQVSGLTPQGGTNLEDAMNLAYQTALRHYLAEGVNRVVLLTDGAANLGDVEPESLKQKVEAHRKQGIALDCFGIGWEGFNDDLLEVLSRNGDGRYGFINSPEEAATEFAGQLAGALQVAASDVKVQVEFNPRRVTAYRQIGYAKHQLTKEQFRDNTVDAAEIAAAEAGNALYAVEANPAGVGPLAIVRVRFKVPGTADYREHEWAVPFTGNAAPLEHASSAMRLAATASAFSEWLVSSPFAGEVTPDRLLGYLGGVPEIYGADARPKKLEWMIQQAKSIAGK